MSKMNRQTHNNMTYMCIYVIKSIDIMKKRLNTTQSE